MRSFLMCGQSNKLNLIYSQNGPFLCSNTYFIYKVGHKQKKYLQSGNEWGKMVESGEKWGLRCLSENTNTI